MKNKSNSNKTLKLLIDLGWYGSLTAATVLILTVILFDCAIIGLFKIDFKIPFPPVKIDNHIYRIGLQYVEVRRSDSIINEYTGMELAKMLYWSNPYFDNAVKDLYDLDFNRMRPMPKEGNRLSMIIVDSKINLAPIRYITHKINPTPVIGLSSYSLILALFLIIILYNLRELFKNSYVGNTFSHENSTRLKYIGIYFLLGELLRVLVFFWINNSVARAEWVNAIRQSYKFSLSDINFTILLAGIIFLMLSHIFKMGTILKQENDLTV